MALKNHPEQISEQDGNRTELRYFSFSIWPGSFHKEINRSSDTQARRYIAAPYNSYNLTILETFMKIPYNSLSILPISSGRSTSGESWSVITIPILYPNSRALNCSSFSMFSRTPSGSLQKVSRNLIE